MFVSVQGNLKIQDGNSAKVLLLMIEILHNLKDPSLWELWYVACYG